MEPLNDSPGIVADLRILVESMDADRYPGWDIVRDAVDLLDGYLDQMTTMYEPIDAATYVAILNGLNAAHRAVTDHVVDGVLPIQYDAVLDAINVAIRRTQQAHGGV